MKVCFKCKIEKSEDDFHKDNARKDGLFPYCRECRGVKRKKQPRVFRRIHSKGYILLDYPEHPLSQSNGYVYEHRLVFHNYFKGEKLKCEKCGADWLWRTYFDHIDHIDEDKSNNDISNLRPLCNSCNVQRTKRIQSEAKGRVPITYNSKTLTANE